MNDAIRAKVARIQELVGIIDTAEIELEQLLMGAQVMKTPAEEAPKIKGKRGGGSGPRLCGICRKPGHQARTCEEPIAMQSPRHRNTAEEKIELRDETDLADAIKDEWAEGGRSSRDVCQELGISLGRFNEIVTKYEIVRQTD